MEDQIIIDLYFDRHELALVKSEEKYGKRMYKTANNILNSDSDAKECVNDTLLATWNAIPPERPKFLGAFLSKITRNLAINKWKAGRAQKRGGSETDLLLDELQDCIPAAGDLEKTYESDLIVDTINNYLAGVEQEVRIMFVMRYFHGESIGNISHHFTTSESNVKSKLFRLRKKLGTHLEKEGIVL